MKAVRLSESLAQADLAERAEVSVSTGKPLEKAGQSSVASLVRVVQALGLTEKLQSLFVIKLQSIAEMEQAQLATRQRAPRKTRAAQKGQPWRSCGCFTKAGVSVDPKLAIALRAMHERPAASWSSAQLAREVAMSRSAFFERFSQAVGVAPITYLLAWRMALAGNCCGAAN